MIRNFFKHIGESLKNLKRNGWMTVAAVSSVMITLVLVGIFLSVIMNVSNLATDIEKNVQINVFMKLDVHDQQKQIPDTKDKTKLVDNPNYLKVHNEIQQVAGVQKITFSSRDQQLEDLIKSIPSYKLFKGDANPLYDAYVVTVKTPSDVKPIAAELAKLQGVGNVNYGGQNADRIFKLANFIRLWGTGAAILLLLVAIFLIQNTIRITIMSRQREIQIMRLVGARNGYIRWPFFLEGAWVGLLGSIVPSALLVWLYKVAYEGFTPTLHSANLSLLPPATFIPEIIGIMVVLGVLIGSFGALLSMRRFLRI